MVITFVTGSYTAVWPLLGAGKSTEDEAIWIHVGVPSSPFASVRTQVSPKATPLPPPNIVMRLVVGSYVALLSFLAAGRVPVGESCVHVGVPPEPLAFESTQTSLKSVPLPLAPPKRMNSLLVES